jgi:hypothetical protein
VQVNASGSACGAHAANTLTLFDALTFANIDLVKVSVQRGPAFRTFDQDHIAKAPEVSARVNDDSIVGG